MNPKPFDINLAKQGHPVVTRDGRSARIICFDRKDPTYPLVALLPSRNGGPFEVHSSFSKDGKFDVYADEAPEDLFMAPRKVTKWVNFYGWQALDISFHPDRTTIQASRDTYDTKDEAEKCHEANRPYIGAHPVEIEL